MSITVRATCLEDRVAWNLFCKSYATFYGVDQTDEMRDRVWGWIHNEGEEVQGLMPSSRHTLAEHLGGHYEPVAGDFEGSSIQFKTGRELIRDLGHA